MKQNVLFLCLVCLGTIFVGCEGNRPIARNVFRLEDGPGGTIPGARYGYLGAEPVTDVRRSPGLNGGSGTEFVKPIQSVGGQNPGVKVTEPEKVNPIGSNTDQGTGAGSIAKKETPTKKEEPAKPNNPEGNKPYATPVPGKFGHVYSPFASGREVDVKDFPPGTEVRCPYTKRIFRVP